MSLQTGTKLGPYEILAPLGAGGMGEVWKAKDTRLDRLVAMKVLPEHLAADPDALGRFEREAKAVAALNHPNIVAIHDFAIHGETPYVVMELLEGESLFARLAKGPIPPIKATELAIQLAQGLAAAHKKGVVHRDLKPGNLWITKEGRLKILDFGLAKKVAPEGHGSQSHLTTQAINPGRAIHTEKGMILGTLGYMSPEQVRGEPVDARSDLFSCGVVFFEMLTGRRAFARDTAADTMAAILKEDPAQGLPSNHAIPAGLRRVIGHCLEKDSQLRFEGARDLAFALESTSGEPGSEKHPDQAAPKWKTSSILIASVGVILLLCLGLFWASSRGPEPASAVAVRPLTYSGHDSSPAASPDGKTIAFTSDRDGQPRIWLKQLNGGGERTLTDGPDDFPRFSPDGTSILFIRSLGGSTSLHRISLLGNDPHRVVDGAMQGDWSPDGKQIAFIRLLSSQDPILSALFLVDASGGTERELARFAGDLTGFPRWSPDGQLIIVNTPPIVSSGVSRNFFLVKVKDGSFSEILTKGQGQLSSAAWISPEVIVYLQAESVSGGTTAVSASKAYLQNIHTLRGHSLFWVGSSGATLDLLPDGRVIFDGMSGRQNLREYSLDGHHPPRWITQGTINDRQPVFAPDGDWVVFSSNRSGNLDLWAISTRTGIVRTITEDPADDWDPGYSPDGKSVLWSSRRSGNLEIWASNPDGTGAHQISHDGEDAQNPTQTRDGRWIFYSSANRKSPGLWKIHPDGSGAELVTKATIQLPEVSPDGAYATYLISVRAKSTLHVIRLEDRKDTIFAEFPEPRRRTGIFPGRVRWMPDGKRIIFTGQNEQGFDGVFIQDFMPDKNTTATRRPLAGFDPDWKTESLGLSPDGKRLVLSESERIFSLMVAEGVQGLGRQKGNAK